MTTNNNLDAPSPGTWACGNSSTRNLDLGCAPGRANTGDKLLTLVASALTGGDCIDDADACVPARFLRRAFL